MRKLVSLSGFPGGNLNDWSIAGDSVKIKKHIKKAQKRLETSKEMLSFWKEQFKYRINTLVAFQQSGWRHFPFFGKRHLLCLEQEKKHAQDLVAKYETEVQHYQSKIGNLQAHLRTITSNWVSDLFENVYDKKKRKS